MPGSADPIVGSYAAFLYFCAIVSAVHCAFVHCLPAPKAFANAFASLYAVPYSKALIDIFHQFAAYDFAMCDTPGAASHYNGLIN